MSMANELERDMDIDIGGVFGALWARRARLALYGLIAAVLTFFVLQLLSPKYKSETQILIESRSRDFSSDTRGNVEQYRTLLDQEGIASQVQVITSRDVARAVINRLGLAKLPEFDTALTPSGVSDILAVFGLINNPLNISPEERVLKQFYKNLTVSQVPRSRVIAIEFVSKDQSLAALIPNAIADEYLRIQQAAKQGINTEEAAALEPQINRLRGKVRSAEGKVASYRSSSDLLMGDNNATLASQQLSEMSTELSRVRSERAEAEAKVASVRSVLKSGASIDSISDVLSAPLIQRLRERQVNLRSQIADLSATLLPAHPRIKSIKSQLANLDQQVRNEATKILRSLRNDASVARSREKSLIANLNNLKAESARVGEDQVELRALEREATAQRELLQTYLRRFREAISKQGQNFLAADARIISRATIPSESFFPKVLPLVIAAFVGTILVSAMFVLAAALASARPQRMMLPMPVADAEPIEELQVAPEVANLQPVAGNIKDRSDSGAAIAAKSISMLGKARVAMLSPEGEVGSEGSVLLARYLGAGGASVIVVDMTGAGASSLAMTGPHSLPGIKDLLAGEASFSDVIHSDNSSRAHIIPTGTASAEVAAMAGDRLIMVFEALEDTYDYVIIDCGAADVAGLSKVSKPNTINVINAMDENNPSVRMAADMLVHAGFRKPLIIHPTDHERQIMGNVAA